MIYDGKQYQKTCKYDEKKILQKYQKWWFCMVKCIGNDGHNGMKNEVWDFLKSGFINHGPIRTCSYALICVLREIFANSITQLNITTQYLNSIPLIYINSICSQKTQWPHSRVGCPGLYCLNNSARVSSIQNSAVW